jgi:hypothetical protein
MPSTRTKLTWAAMGVMIAGLLAACGGNGGAPSPTATPVAPGEPAATPAPSNYFAGRNVRIIIPYAPGGSSAVLVPYFSQELPKFIPGSPRMSSSHLTPVVAGMNYLHAAGQDGTEMMYVATPQLAQQYADGSDFRVADFDYIGGFTVSEFVLYVTQQVTAPEFLDMRGQEPTLRVALPTDPADMSASEFGTLIVADAFGVPMRGIPLSGATTGTPELLVALERGDINGHIGGVYYTLPQLRPGWTRDGYVRPLAFIGRPGVDMRPNTEADVTAANITDLILNATDVSEERKEQYRAFTIPAVSLGRHYMFPPGTDPEAIEAMRQGFAAAMQDAAFLEGLERLLGIEPVFTSGEDFQELMNVAAAAFDSQRENLAPLQNELWEKFTAR